MNKDIKLNINHKSILEPGIYSYLNIYISLFKPGSIFLNLNEQNNGKN